MVYIQKYYIYMHVCLATRTKTYTICIFVFSDFWDIYLDA